MPQFQVDVLTWGVGWNWGAEWEGWCRDGDVEECTVRTLYRRDDGGCGCGCGVDLPSSDVEEVNHEGLEDIFPGVRNVCGDRGQEKEREQGVGYVKAPVVGLLTYWWKGGDGEDGEEGDGKKAKLDVTVVETTQEGGDGVEEIEVEGCVCEEIEVDNSANEAVIWVEGFMGKVCGELDGGKW